VFYLFHELFYFVHLRPVFAKKYSNIYNIGSANFSYSSGSSELTTSRIGRVVLHTVSAGSTMDFVDGAAVLHDGLVVVADEQTQGRGRAGNVWLSPVGQPFAGLIAMIAIFGIFKYNSDWHFSRKPIL
jgi:biotin--protein ligase